MTTQEIIQSTPDQFWHWWLNSSPYIRPGDGVKVTDPQLIISRAKKREKPPLSAAKV